MVSDDIGAALKSVFTAHMLTSMFINMQSGSELQETTHACTTLIQLCEFEESHHN